MRPRVYQSRTAKGRWRWVCDAGSGCAGYPHRIGATLDARLHVKAKHREGT